MSYSIKQHDSAPVLKVTLQQVNKRPIDLTGATLRFHMKGTPPSTKTINAAATITDPTKGKAEYRWALDGSDTSEVGVFKGEFEITYPDSRVQTVPTVGWIDINVEAEQG